MTTWSKRRPSLSRQSLSRTILPSTSPLLQLSSLTLKPVPSRRQPLLQSRRQPFLQVDPPYPARFRISLPVRLLQCLSVRVQSVHLRVQHLGSMSRSFWIQLTTPALRSLFKTDNLLTALQNLAKSCICLETSCLTHKAESLTFRMTI